MATTTDAYTSGKYDYTQDELRAQAEAIYNPAYEATVNSLNAQKNTINTNTSRTLEDYSEYVDKKLVSTEKKLNDSLIKRGMGRSDRGTYEIAQGLADVNAEAQESIAEIEQDRTTNLANVDTQLATALATKEQNISAKMLDLMQYYESVRQFEKEYALKAKSLSGGGGGGGGGSSVAATASSVYGNKGTGYTGASTTPTGLKVKNGQYTYNGKTISKAQAKKYLSIY